MNNTKIIEVTPESNQPFTHILMQALESISSGVANIQSIYLREIDHSEVKAVPDNGAIAFEVEYRHA